MDKRIFLTLVLLLGAMFLLKDVKDALAKLKSRRDAVKAKLVELGANKETVEVGEEKFRAKYARARANS